MKVNINGFVMIIEIKDLPNGQSIDKIDIHIDFQKSIASIVSQPSPNKISEIRNGVTTVYFLIKKKNLKCLKKC